MISGQRSEGSVGQRRDGSKNGGGKKVPPMGERLNEVSFQSATDTVQSTQSQTTTEEILANSVTEGTLANSVTGSDSGYRTESSHTELKEPLHNRGHELAAGELAADEHMALNVLHSSDVHPSLTAIHVHSSDVYSSLKAVNDSLMSDNSLVSDHDHSVANTSVVSSDGGSTEDMDSSAEVLYSYRSPPKSASRRQPDLVSPLPRICPLFRN